MSKTTEVLKPLENVTPSQLGNSELFNKRQMASYGLLQTCLGDVRDSLAKYNEAITEATVIVSMIFAQSGKSEDVKYDRKLKRELKNTIENRVVGLSNGTIELLLRAARDESFQSLLGIKAGTKTPNAAIKRYEKLSKKDGSKADHAMGWARSRPDMLNTGTGNRVAKKKTGLETKTIGPVIITIASQEVAKHVTEHLVTAFTGAGCKFKDMSAFKSAAHLVIGQLLDEHTDQKMEILKKKKA